MVDNRSKRATLALGRSMFSDWWIKAVIMLASLIFSIELTDIFFLCIFKNTITVSPYLQQNKVYVRINRICVFSRNFGGHITYRGPTKYAFAG